MINIGLAVIFACIFLRTERIFMKFLNNCSLLQVFNILADYHGKAVCIFNIVMSCRKFEMYKRVLQKIKE